MMHVVAQVMMCAAGLGALTFVIAYELLADWRSTALGRNVMAFMAAITVLLTLAALRSYIPWIRERVELLRAISFTTVGAIVWHRVYLLIRAQLATSERRSSYGGTTVYTDEGNDR